MATLWCAVKCGATCIAGCQVDSPAIPVADWFVAATGSAKWARG